MDKKVGFKVFVTFLCIRAPLVFGDVVCRLGVVSTEGVVGGRITVEGQFFYHLLVEFCVSHYVVLVGSRGPFGLLYVFSSFLSPSTLSSLAPLKVSPSSWSSSV
jgi:hypothetical protein